MPNNETFKEFLRRKIEEGKEEEYESRLKVYDVAAKYVKSHVEDYLDQLCKHSEDKYREIFGDIDYKPIVFGFNTKKFESVYMKVYEGKCHEEEIFDKIKDIARGRIVCRTSAQIKYLKNKLIPYLEDKGLTKKNINDYARKPTQSGYRGINIIFSISKEKVDSDKDVFFELQFMTEMQHTWTELSHNYVYKNKVLNKDDIKFISSQMTHISTLIYVIDSIYEDIEKEVKRKLIKSKA